MKVTPQVNPRKLVDRSYRVLKVAFVSRLLVILTSYLTHVYSGEYDASSVILLLEHGAVNSSDSVFSEFLRTFVRWDAVHFLTIANKGYQFEQQLAFFPGLPVLIRLFAGFIRPATFYLEDTTRLALVGLVLGNVAFILATFVLYKLSCLLFEEKFGFTTSLLFTLTPTPGFMSSIYTEPYFALFTFSGMYFYHKQYLWYASILWTIACTFRSNGILLAGYLLFDVLFVFKWSFKTHRRSLAKVLTFLPQFILILSPFFIFQYFAYVKLCIEGPVEGASPWCQRQIPVVYSYVQSEYWGCGLFTFYTPNEKIPYLISAPLILFSFNGIISYAKFDLSRFFSIGLLQRKPSTLVKWTKPPQGRKDTEGYFQLSILPHIYLWLVLVLYDLVYMHLAVILRFLTSMPALYWFASHVILSRSSKSHAVVYYWLLYGVVSTALFATYFPPS